jgi:hypothetical protein
MCAKASTASSGTRNAETPASRSRSSAADTLASPIQQAITGLRVPRAASITTSAAASALVIACGVRITTMPSTPASPRHAESAAR